MFFPLVVQFIATPQPEDQSDEDSEWEGNSDEEDEEEEEGVSGEQEDHTDELTEEETLAALIKEGEAIFKLLPLKEQKRLLAVAQHHNRMEEGAARESGIPKSTAAAGSASSSSLSDSATDAPAPSASASASSSSPNASSSPAPAPAASIISSPSLAPEGPTFACPICLDSVPEAEGFKLGCGHQMCQACLSGFYSMKVNEGNTVLTCPEPKCTHAVLASELKELLSAPIYDKFVKFSLKRSLKLIPHVHSCPAPDCDYAVIIEPKKWFGLVKRECSPSKQDILCQNPSCGISFCYTCGETSHPDLSCEENKVLLHKMDGQVAGEHVKPCPKCATPIFKLQDGTCNHMKCTACGTDFCWLCMKEINDMHYFSPSGCTFYAAKPWSLKKKVIGQLTFATLAPVVIGLAAVVTVPAVMIAFPMSMTKKIRKRVRDKKKRALAYTLGVPGSIIVSPLLAAAAVAVGVPVLLIGAYVVVPAYLANEHSKSQKLKKEKKRRVAAIDAAAPHAEEAVEMIAV